MKQTQPNAKYHIHINGKEMGKETPKKLEELGCYHDPFVQDVQYSYAPKIHFTYDPRTPDERNRIWEKLLDILDSDEDYIGYIETESIPLVKEIEFDNPTEYNPNDAEFNLRKLPLVPVPNGMHKAADIHVKRKGSLPRDSLDKMLLDRGFYEVHTANPDGETRNRIYTVQTQTIRDAKEIHRHLVDYISQTGGATKIEFEVATALKTYPENYELVPFVPEGGAF